MSSFIGHTLNTIGIYANSQPAKTERLDRRWALLWLGWLTFVGVAPDLDYVIPQLHATRLSMATDLRVTHSLVGTLTFPLLTIFVLAILPVKRATRQRLGIQVTLVGLSHVLMDMLVGVWPLPLLWPFSHERSKLPFGILPSAPAFQFENPYLYRNVLMEIGIFLPLYGGIYLWQHARGWKRSGALALWLCTAGFIVWAFGLAR